MEDNPLPASTDKRARRKRLVIYISISALVIITVYLALANVFIPPTVTDFELQVTDWDYKPSIGTFRVSGTIGNKVPPNGHYKLWLVSITDGNKTIVLHHSDDGFTYIRFSPTSSNPERAGPDWTFQSWSWAETTLESKVVQLNFEYEIGHDGLFGYNILETGTEVFTVNVE